MMTTIQDYILDYHHGMGMFYLDFVLLAESHVFFVCYCYESIVSYVIM